MRTHWLRAALAVPLFLMPGAPLAAERQHKERSVPLSWREPSVVHVAKDIATVLRFDSPLRPDGVTTSGAPGRFTVHAEGDRLIVSPLEDLTAQEGASLAVTLASGERATFSLVSSPREVDVQVHAVPPAPPRPQYQTQLGQFGAKLDQCLQQKAELEKSRDELDRLQEEQERESAGHSALLLTLLAQDDQAVFLTRMLGESIDGETARLEVLKVHRATWGRSFALIRVTNLSGKTLTLEKPELSAPTGTIQLVGFASGDMSLPPDKDSLLVVEYRTPEDPRLALTIAVRAKNIPQSLVKLTVTP